jgi:hypothetical protein
MKVCQGTTANCTFVLEPESLKFLFINKLSFLHPWNNKNGNKKIVSLGCHLTQTWNI